MPKIKSIKKIVPKNKTVLVRFDFNVEINKGKIEDDMKIVAALPTIRYLLRYKNKLVMMTHLSDTKKDKKSMTKREKSSTKIVAKRLEKLLNKKVKHANSCIGKKVENEVNNLKPGEMLLLEDLRRKQGEENNDKKFAQELARLGEIYVNDAFAVSHRNHASLSAIKKFLPAYAGLLVEKEIEQLNKILTPKKPLVVILGGAKVATKAPLVKKLGKNAEKILLGGALVNNFFKMQDYEVGRSLIDEKSTILAKKIKIKNILLPIDVVTTKEAWPKVLDKKAIKIEVKRINEVDKKDMIIDIGPDTIRLFANQIKKAATIIWNGPMGYFENKKSKNGTLAIAREVAIRSGQKTFSVAGGGDTIEALKMSKTFADISWVSTGGGAMLTYLGGGKMPGLKGIVK